MGNVQGKGVLAQPLVFVDIETNGLNHVRGRVIEVAAIRVEGGVVTRRFNTLIDPECELPHYITRLTGITTNELKHAPTFDQIADELQEVLAGAIFVAHNVRFDYSFLKQEFGRLGLSFLPKQLCTMKLSRVLFPHERGHKLADLIRRYELSYSRRHRAYDDAAVLWQFLRYVNKHFPPEQLAAAVARQLRQPALPKHLEPALVQELPESPGVYIFEDEAGRPLYVGKSVNIKKRVLSHFGRDHAETKEFKIAQRVAHITAHQTPGELAALLLESRLVKQLQPLYNRQLRRTDTLIVARRSSNEAGYHTVSLEEARQIDPATAHHILAIYTHRGKARQALNELLRTYGLCPKLLGLEKAEGGCFLQQLRKCRGACAGRETPAEYNCRLDMAFARQRIQAWPYDSPVLLAEKTTAQPRQALIVDKWCIMGEVAGEAENDPVVHLKDGGFDLDTYKILQSFLATKADRLWVRKVSLRQLQSWQM